MLDRNSISCEAFRYERTVAGCGKALDAEKCWRGSSLGDLLERRDSSGFGEQGSVGQDKTFVEFGASALGDAYMRIGTVLKRADFGCRCKLGKVLVVDTELHEPRL